MTAEMIETTLVQAQRAYEAEALKDGADRYFDRLAKTVKRGGFDKHDEVRKLIEGAIPILSAGIDKWIATASAAKGRPPAALGPVKALKGEKCAAIGLTSVFREIARDGYVRSIAMMIGGRIETELEAAAAATKDPKAAEAFLKFADTAPSERALAVRVRKLIEDNEAALNWSDQTKTLVGQAVLNVVLIELKDVFELYRGARGKAGDPEPIIRLTEGASEAIVGMEEAAALMRPVLRPMIAKPRKWNSLTSGAYLDYRLSTLVPLVSAASKQQRNMLRAAIKDGSMSEALDALNAIQETRFAIDTRILQWVRWARAEGKRTGDSFPSDDLPEPPPMVEAEVWAAMSKEERYARSRRRKAVKNVRKAMENNRRVYETDVATADRLAGEECFYLPHFLDTRGRTYAAPYFNHQRSDHLKALFRFADGVPLGTDGGEWLMIHLANCGDFKPYPDAAKKVSKLPFEDRVTWVKANEAKIIATAAAPDVFFEFWSEADSPFCFLQACFEYAEWVRSGYSPDFVSFIAGAADGSCSGLQHYSAITRSEDEASHVNLVARDDVGDIYQLTADTSRPTLELCAVGGDIAAGLILANGFGRSENKRNVMTYFYGSERFGMRDQHMKDLMDPLSDKVALGELKEHPYGMLVERTDKETGEKAMRPDGGYTCASTMAAHIYKAVTTIAAKADEAAQWIRTVASVLAHEGQAMCWVAPTGFPAVQRYVEYTHKAVNLWVYDRALTPATAASTDKTDKEGNVLTRLQLLMREAPTPRIDKKAMRNASSPNVIHSMDAAHLHRSVVMAKAEGIEHFAMIHDSFGTHLGNMAKFGRIIREAFVATYADYCPLAELERYARSVLSEEGIAKIPPRPARGSYDLKAVLEAKYAFA